MKKNILLSLILLNIISVSLAQVTISQGAPGTFTLEKGTEFMSFSKGGNYCFIEKKSKMAEKIYTMMVCDKNGNVNVAGEIKMNQGVFNNFYNINEFAVLDDKLLVFINNPNKETGKNTLAIRTLDNTATLSKEETTVGVIDFKKMNNQGFWRMAVSPDKKHLAVIAQLPFEKEQPSKFKFYFFDAGLKKIKEGEFALPGEGDKASLQCYTSDKGDLFLTKDKYEKGNLIPTIYQTSISDPAVKEFNVLLTAPQKVFNYATTVSPAGDLIVAGYYHENKAITSGETKAKGVWIYNSSVKDAKVSPYTNLIENLTPRGFVFNGNTAFFIGESFKEERETNTASGAGAFDYNYKYTQKEIVVTAFDNASWSKKFDVTLNKNSQGMNFNQDLFPAYGVINGKLAVVYNDRYGKYFPKDSYYAEYKLPVLNFVTNDGLLEQPIHFEKEFQIPPPRNVDAYTLYPMLFNNGMTNEIIMLSRYGNNFKGIVFRGK